MLVLSCVTIRSKFAGFLCVERMPLVERFHVSLPRCVLDLTLHAPAGLRRRARRVELALVEFVRGVVLASQRIGCQRLPFDEGHAIADNVCEGARLRYGLSDGAANRCRGGRLRLRLGALQGLDAFRDLGFAGLAGRTPLGGDSLASRGDVGNAPLQLVRPRRIIGRQMA
jgi:hypothetical protein